MTINTRPLTLNEYRQVPKIEKWNFVKTNSKLANMLTKCLAYLFKPTLFWWEGPQFLTETNVQNIFDTDIIFEDESNELKTTAVNIATSNLYSISHIIKGNVRTFQKTVKLLLMQQYLVTELSFLSQSLFSE